jgi:hypothetical protein
MTLAALLAAVAGSAAGADAVERRGGEPPVTGRLQTVDDAGVRISSDVGAEVLVPWDRVRRIVADQPDHDIARYLEVADDLWRARSRIERHDTTLAEPLLERLFETYRGRTHETALVVSEGLLRCRLARGEQVLAVIPALETARLRRAGVQTASYAMLPSVLDESTGLCPAVPPFWATTRGLDRLSRELERYEAKGDAVVAGLARLYRAAALRQLRPADAPAVGESYGDEPGVAFLFAVVECSAPDADARDEARQRLERGIDRLDPWAQAWVHFALGDSLLRESGVGRQQRGLVHLAHLPARLSGHGTFLSALALARLAAAADAAGDRAAAESLRMELRNRYPRSHLRWPLAPVAAAATPEDSS